jgi:eukaryotic-like serine/threonine-protein kinase
MMSMRERPNLVGQQFGSYRLLRLLGAGGFAEVYLGEHIDLGTQAAIKILHTQLRPTDIDAFRTEARIIARLLHPHIIRVLDFNAAGSTPFLVMDYAVGGTMRERYPKGTIVPLDTIVSSTQQVADALQHAHDEKLIHRDIKPENILLGEQHNVLLSDFGIALVAQSSYYQSTQEIAGTAAYMSPEQFRGKPEKASDQYAVAIVVYEWLSGSLPFSEGNFIRLGYQHTHEPVPPLREKVPTISREVEHVVMTALAKDPKQRFDSVRAFATALQQAIQAQQAQAIISTHPQIDDTTLANQPGHSQPIVPPNPQANNVLVGSPSIDIIPQGSQRWAFSTSGPVISSPTVQSGIVYFGSNDHKLYALDATSGQPMWSFQTEGRVQSSPAVINSVIYFGSWDHKLYALDATSGQPMWSFLTNGLVYSSPAVANGIVYLGSEDRNLYALDASSGQQIWSFLTGSYAYSSPTVQSGIVYFGSHDGNLYALDASSGQKMWSFPTRDRVYSSPTVVNGVVYFGSYDGNLYALNTTSGQKMWSFPTRDHVYSSPTVQSGIVYFGSHDGNLYALNTTSGQKMWSFPTSDRVHSSPTVVNGVVYVGSRDGNLYALFA